MCSASNTPLRSKDIALIGMMTATLEVAKTALNFLPNIELVTLLVILYSLYLGKRVFFAVYAFALIEGLLFGFGVWWIMYLYIWPLLAVITLVFKNVQGRFFWALLAAAFGLFFGLFCAIPYLFIGGPSMAFSWWIAGIPYDFIHCASNFLVVLVLLPPLRKVMERFSFN